MTLFRSLLAIVLGLGLTVSAFAEDATPATDANNAQTVAMPADAAKDQTAAAAATDSKDAPKAEATMASAEKVNINTADEAALTKVKGITKKRAKAIIAYREKNGNFASVEDLTKIKGITKAFVKKHAEKLAV